MTSERSICKAIIALGKAANEIDDGYHNNMVFDIIKMRNYLSSELSDKTNERLSEWYNGRDLGGNLIEEA